MLDVTTRLLPLPAVIALIAVGAAASVLLYRRDRELVSPATGRWLLGLRIAEAMLLIALLGDPVRVTREKILERGEVIVAVDSSRSFAIVDGHRPPRQVDDEARALAANPDEVRGMTRRELAAAMLRGGWLDDLRGRFDVSLFALARELKPIEELPAADGDVTDLARPLVEEASRRPKEKISGVIVVTDGNHHAPGTPRAPQEAARQLALLGVPIVAIGVGALEKPPDLAIESIDAIGKVFAADTVQAQVTIAAAGLPALETTISITDGDRVVKTAVAAVPAGEGLTKVPVEIPAGAPGRKKLTFSIPAAPGEVTPSNNSRDLWLEVLSDKARVLLVDGTPRWEERYLRASWSRDRSVELASFLVTPPPEKRLPSGFPRGREELFAHDVIVIGDVDPSVFTREEVESLRDFVMARGGALVVIAGERAMPYRWSGTPLAEVLPVELSDPAPPVDASSALARDGLSLALTQAGSAAAITRLVPGRERNAELWELLPRPVWVSPVAGMKPGAELLVTAKDLPVFVTRAYGAGRVFFAGIDSTWKWRYRFGDELHGRFWGQVVRWALSSRLGSEDDHARLGTSAVVYPTSARIDVEATVQSAPGKPFEAERVDAVITRVSDGKSGRVRLDPIPRSGGRYHGDASLEEIGVPPSGSSAPSEYSVRLDAPDLPGYSTREDRATALFVVEPPVDLEARDLACDSKLLEEVAAISGGRFFPLSRFREAQAALVDRSREVERTVESSPWDQPAALSLVLLGLIAAEWVLRKRRDLV